eukprot:gene6683-2605_t
MSDSAALTEDRKIDDTLEDDTDGVQKNKDKRFKETSYHYWHNHEKE